MILLLGILLGMLAGLGRARRQRCAYSLPAIRGFWLVFAAFLPQLLAFYAPGVRGWVTQPVAALALVGSQVLLMVFVWLNRTRAGFWLLGLGLAMNLAVIAANGGLMPISPQTIQRLAPHLPLHTWQSGSRFGTTKDIILERGATRLEWLADRFVAPDWFPQRVAFSIGDVIIACGAFWLLWQAGKCPEPAAD